MTWVVSVVGRSTRRRWSVVAAGVAVLVGGQLLAPASARMLDEPTPAIPPDTLVERALRSADVPHEAVARIHGSFGAPELPRLGGLAALLGDTTRTRVWWSSPSSWRVDTLRPGGEIGTYGFNSTVVRWDYERSQLTTVFDRRGLRLPRADDLLPPQAARRLLAGVADADRVVPLPDKWVAGRTAAGVRVVGSDERGTVGHVDIWMDPDSGLPVEFRVVDRDGAEVLMSTYLELTMRTPENGVLIPPHPPGVPNDWTSTPDIAATVDARAPWVLPYALTGLSRQVRTPVDGAAVYGEGLVSFAVLPLPANLGNDMLTEALDAGAATIDGLAGEAALVTSSVLNIVVARGPDPEHAYVLAGLVVPDVLEEAAASLLANPPPRRDS